MKAGWSMDGLLGTNRSSGALPDRKDCDSSAGYRRINCSRTIELTSGSTRSVGPWRLASGARTRCWVKRRVANFSVTVNLDILELPSFAHRSKVAPKALVSESHVAMAQLSHGDPVRLRGFS